MPLKHDEGWTMPPDAPFYPRLPAVYRNVRFQIVCFTARADAVTAYLPEPLEVSPGGECVAAGLDVGFSTSYGSFQEAFLLLRCRLRGQSGFYVSHVFHNGPAGIAAGREIYGTPKIFAEVAVQDIDRSLVTEVRMSSTPVLRIATVAEQAIESSALPKLAPAWRLKVIPRADRPTPAIKQLIDGSHAMRDQIVHFCARGRGTVSFAASPLVNLTPLEPIAFDDAFYLETSYSEDFAQIVYDYLEK